MSKTIHYLRGQEYFIRREKIRAVHYLSQRITSYLLLSRGIKEVHVD